MARRTKEDALATRHLILDTAESVFVRRGVSRATLMEIAQAAGLSRGAIYWHFKDKAELFDAMMQRVLLPLETKLQMRSAPESVDALAQLRLSCVAALKNIVDDPQVRRVFEIAIHKVEYVDELEAVRERRSDACKGHLAHIERTMLQVMARGELPQRVCARAAALGLHSLLEGLFQNWMLDPRAFDLVVTGTQVIDTYLAGLATTNPATTNPATLNPVRPEAAPGA